MTLHRTNVRAHAVNGRAAFTLMEMLVVVAILLILVGAAVPIYLAYRDDAQIDRSRADVKMIGDACSNYNARYGRYPNSLEELVQPPSGGRSYFTEDHLMDPWGKPYNYDPNSTRPGTGEPLVSTQAPNGQEIRNW